MIFSMPRLLAAEVSHDKAVHHLHWPYIKNAFRPRLLVALTMSLCLMTLLLNPPLARAQKGPVPEAPAPAPADSPGNFKKVFPLEQVVEGGLNRVVLSADVLLGAQRLDLKDLAVFNLDGRLAPAVLISPDALVEEVPSKDYVLPVYPLSDSGGSAQAGSSLSYREINGRLELELKGSGPGLENGPPPKAYVLDLSAPLENGGLKGKLHLAWAAEKFQTGAWRLKLESSPNLSQWRIWAHDLTLLATSDESGSPAMSQGFIELPELKDKFIRLTWLGEGGPKITGARWLGASRVKELRPETPTAALPGNLSFDEEGRPQLTYSPGGRPPVAAMRLLLSEAASFQSLLWGRDSESQVWQRIGQVNSYRYTRDDTSEQSPPWPFGGRSYRHYLLTPVGPWPVFQRPPDLELILPPRELVFLAQGGGPYQLAVGHDSAVQLPPAPPEAARYDSSRPLARLGSALVITASPAAEAEPEPLPWTEGPAAVWVFRGVLLLGLIILTALALNLYRQTKKIPPTEN